MKEVVNKAETLLDGKVSIVKEVRSDAYQVHPLQHMHTGHKLWEIDVANGIVDEAQFTGGMTHFLDKHKKVDKFVKIKKGCLYIAALNEVNALKKFNKISGANAIVES